MTEKEINNLRSYFKTRDSIDQEADIWAKQKEGELSKQEAYEQVGEIRYHSFLEGLKAYQNDTGIWPMKVPVYVRNVLIGDTFSKNEMKNQFPKEHLKFSTEISLKKRGKQ